MNKLILMIVLLPLVAVADPFLKESSTQVMVTFPFDSSVPEMTLEEQKTLKALSKDKRVILVGHADEYGTDQYNKMLGLQRAKAISHLIDGEVAELSSSGKSKPLVQCSEGAFSVRVECLHANRRVEVTMISQDLKPMFGPYQGVPGIHQHMFNWEPGTIPLQ